MHVVGDGTTDSDELGAWRHRQHPTSWYGEALDIAQQHPGFTEHAPVPFIERDEAFKAGCLPEQVAGIEADITIAATHAMG
ncbi:hypothetical protein D9M68_448100 [compost metagenome]